MQEFKRISKADRYLPMSSILQIRPHPSKGFAPIARPEIRTLVEADEAGGKVIRLSDGFPVRRSSYGRIRLEQRSMGEGTQ